MHDKNSSWHHQPISHVLAELLANINGLSEAEAQQRLATHGSNRLPEAKKRGMFVRFLLQFHNILIYVLLASAAITGFLQHWLDTAVILAVVIANAIIGIIQEGKAEKAMDAIRHMLAPRANVLRDGTRRSIPGQAVVPGDIIFLEAGDKVPADLRLFSVHNISVQEAILTGESVPVEKRIEPVNLQVPLGDPPVWPTPAPW
jgi:magnesium-transporting ATPase (P-type)